MFAYKECCVDVVNEEVVGGVGSGVTSPDPCDLEDNFCPLNRRGGAVNPFGIVSVNPCDLEDKNCPLNRRGGAVTPFGIVSVNPCDLKDNFCPSNRRGQGHVKPNWFRSPGGEQGHVQHQIGLLTLAI